MQILGSKIIFLLDYLRIWNNCSIFAPELLIIENKYKHVHTFLTTICMKKVILSLFLSAAVCSLYATNYYYQAGVTKVTVQDNSTESKPYFKVSLTQNCLNTVDHKLYESTVDLALYPKTHALEGTYSVADGTIKKDFSAVYYNNNTRRPNESKTNTFVIKKIDETHYAIGAGELNVQNLQGTNQYNYLYCYDGKTASTLTDFEFTFGEEEKPTVAKYDMTVVGHAVMRFDDDYGNTRYMMTLNCQGKRLGTNSVYNYEVQLNLHPNNQDIAASYSTAQSATNILLPSDTYVQWQKTDGSVKTRYVASDSLSTIKIEKLGENQYRFVGGKLICQDVEFTVMGEKKIKQNLYYHFDAPFDFGFDEDSKNIDVIAESVKVEKTVDGYDLTAAGGGYTVYITLESESLAGSFTTSNGLSTWSKVSMGSKDSYVESTSTATIVHKSGDTYSLSANLLCENGYTYILAPIDFTYSETPTNVENVNENVNVNKILHNGQLIIRHNDKYYQATGAEIK